MKFLNNKNKFTLRTKELSQCRLPTLHVGKEKIKQRYSWLNLIYSNI